MPYLKRNVQNAAILIAAGTQKQWPMVKNLTAVHQVVKKESFDLVRFWTSSSMLKLPKLMLTVVSKGQDQWLSLTPKHALAVRSAYKHVQWMPLWAHPNKCILY